MAQVQTVGSVSIVKAPNSLVGENLTQCRKLIDDCFVGNRSFIILDMGESALLNSDALEFIVDTQQACLSRGGKLVIAESQPLCAEILSITGVEDCVAVFKDLRSALAEFAK